LFDYPLARYMYASVSFTPAYAKRAKHSNCSLEILPYLSSVPSLYAFVVDRTAFIVEILSSIVSFKVLIFSAGYAERSGAGFGRCSMSDSISVPGLGSSCGLEAPPEETPLCFPSKRPNSHIQTEDFVVQCAERSGARRLAADGS
jgi:hypothetical protein